MPEHNRGNTERRIKDAALGIIEEQGFDALGINAIADRAKLSKVLIYRYFDSIEGLITKIIEEQDYWINIEVGETAEDDPVEQIKSIFHRQAQMLRDNPIVRKFYIWELECNNKITQHLRTERENGSVRIISHYANLLGLEEEKVQVLGVLLTNALVYTALQIDSSPKAYLDLETGKAWNRITDCIDSLLEIWISRQTKK